MTDAPAPAAADSPRERRKKLAYEHIHERQTDAKAESAHHATALDFEMSTILSSVCDSPCQNQAYLVPLTDVAKEICELAIFSTGGYGVKGLLCYQII